MTAMNTTPSNPAIVCFRVKNTMHATRKSFPIMLLYIIPRMDGLNTMISTTSAMMEIEISFWYAMAILLGRGYFDLIL